MSPGLAILVAENHITGRIGMSLFVPLQHWYFYVASLPVVGPMLASVCPIHTSDSLLPLLLFSLSHDLSLRPGVDSYLVHLCVCQYTR